MQLTEDIRYGETIETTRSSSNLYLRGSGYYCDPDSGLSSACGDTGIDVIS